MSDLKRIVKLAELLVKTREEVKQKEDEFKKAKADMLRLEREDLPALMTEIGLTELRLEDGQIIRLQEDVDCRITDGKRPAALAWLIDNGFGGLIKTAVNITFGRGDHDEAVAVRDELSEKYEGVELKEDVHFQTLKSFVREQVSEGKPIPFDLFSIHPYQKAVIRRN